jgi:hypothetical protein
MLDQNQLNTIKVASPCTESWADMKGDGQVRHCGSCDQNVYNLSEMSLDEISRLLAKKEGRTCVRFYRRADGTVLTNDCPVGVARVRRKLAVVAAAMGAVLTAGVAGVFFARGAMARTLRDSKLGQIAAVRALADWMEPRPEYPVMGIVRMPPREKMGEMQIKMGKPAFNRPVCEPSARPEMGAPLPIMGDMAMPVTPKKK